MKNPLSQYAFNVASQFGEDGIIKKIFETLPLQKDYFCVEFGAWNGKFLSNTYNLITNHQWKGVLIEADKKKFEELKDTYKKFNSVKLINNLVNFEGRNTLDNILTSFCSDFPVDFDLLSVDIDGNDYYIWDSVLKYKPKLVVIEFNQSIPNDIEFVQERSLQINHGNSLLSLTKLAKTKGYELIATTLCNGFFIKNEYYPLFGLNNNHINEIWDSEKSLPRIFQLYDGTLVLTKPFILLWKKQKVNQFDLQKLPKMLRYFDDSTSGKNIFIHLFRKLFVKIHNYK